MKSKTLLYIAILVVLLVAAYFLTSDRGEKTSSYKMSDKKIFTLDSAKVDKIEIKTGNGDLVLSKSSGEWRVEQPFNYRTVSANVEALVSSLKNFELESVVSTNPTKAETYGFGGNEVAEVTVYESGAPKGKFYMGKIAPGGGNFAYVKKTEGENIYLADGIDRNNFVKTNPEEWKDKNIVSIPMQSVNSIEYKYEGNDYTVAKDAEGRFVIGTDTVGKDFQNVLGTLQKFDTNNFKDTVLTDETSYTGTVIIDNGAKTQLNFLKLDVTPVKYLVKVSGEDQVFELDEVPARNILKTKEEILK